MYFIFVQLCAQWCHSSCRTCSVCRGLPASSQHGKLFQTWLASAKDKLAPICRLSEWLFMSLCALSPFEHWHARPTWTSQWSAPLSPPHSLRHTRVLCWTEPQPARLGSSWGAPQLCRGRPACFAHSARLRVSSGWLLHHKSVEQSKKKLCWNGPGCWSRPRTALTCSSLSLQHSFQPYSERFQDADRLLDHFAGGALLFDKLRRHHCIDLSSNNWLLAWWMTFHPKGAASSWLWSGGSLYPGLSYLWARLFKAAFLLFYRLAQAWPSS